MYIFYNVPVSPNCGPLRQEITNTTTRYQSEASIHAIRRALVDPLKGVPVIGWIVRLLDQPPFAYLIAMTIGVSTVFAIVRVVSIKHRLEFVTKQLIVVREDSRFLYKVLLKSKHRSQAYHGHSL